MRSPRRPPRRARTQPGVLPQGCLAFLVGIRDPGDSSRDASRRPPPAPVRAPAGFAPAVAAAAPQRSDRERVSAGESARARRYSPKAATHSMRQWRCRPRSRWSNPRAPVSAAADFTCCIARPTASRPCSMRAKRRPPPRPATCTWTRAGNPIARASIDGPLAAAIPGEPAAFDYLGSASSANCRLKESLQPAIRLAREGFPLYPRLQGAIRYKRELLLRSPDAAKVFLTAGRGRARARRAHQTTRPGGHARGDGRPRRAKGFTAAASPKIS